MEGRRTDCSEFVVNAFSYDNNLKAYKFYIAHLDFCSVVNTCSTPIIVAVNMSIYI